MQLRKRIINTNASDVNGYSLVPVNVWSHSVDDVVEVAKALEQTGNFEIITPTTLLGEVETKYRVIINRVFFITIIIYYCNKLLCCCILEYNSSSIVLLLLSSAICSTY